MAALATNRRRGIGTADTEGRQGALRNEYYRSFLVVIPRNTRNRPTAIQIPQPTFFHKVSTPATAVSLLSTYSCLMLTSNKMNPTIVFQLIIKCMGCKLGVFCGK